MHAQPGHKGLNVKGVKDALCLLLLGDVSRLGDGPAGGSKLLGAWGSSQTPAPRGGGLHRLQPPQLGMVAAKVETGRLNGALVVLCLGLRKLRCREVR